MDRTKRREGEEDMSLMRDSLRRSMENQSLVGLHSWEASPDSFSVAQMLHLSDENYVAATFDEQGRRDEYQVGKMERIWMIATGGTYLDAMETLARDHEPDEELPEYVLDLETMLHYAQSSGKVVSLLHENDTSFTGRVTAMDDEYVELDAYSSAGESEGRLIFMRDAIIRAACHGPDHRAMETIIAKRSHGRSQL
jgi:hypothetical protein